MDNIPTEPARNAPQKDTLELGIALLTAASLSPDNDWRRICLYATSILQHAHGLDSEFVKLFQ